MSRHTGNALVATFLLLLWSGLATALTSTLQQVTNFGTNPTNVGMYVYRPTTVSSSPALIVAIHYCTGTAQAYFSGSPYAQLADQYGFIVIYPSSPNSGTCWDVSSKKSLTHNGGGDSTGIASMVAYAKTQWGVDSNKVYVTGSSSGGMMTNVLSATYPDVFKAGIVYSGVAAGCFVSAAGGVDAWNSTCSGGQSTASAAQWASVARDMYPGYTGSYPRMQEYHGTADSTLNYNNLNEEVKQWAGVFGYNTSAPTQVQQNTPLSGYTKSIYGPNLQGISASGVGHTVPIQGAEDLKWFGIVGGTTTAPSGPTTTTAPGTTTAPVSTTSSASGATQSQWGQCGGTGWNGPTACAAGATCVAVSPPYYYQCQ
ncbi:carbohydrate esterase family 1 and carbohydrate-binding module family 1 protein [Schizophyllum amplum]|uniref:Carboxylic ester hydrolase n=1 Tax=Schizophyllum amplum TaxID=97359 RepID=A0A550C6G9_9AGAR|nr:carbohydrate esterase family 1 and carbohydrate-binding module family 1 protein [Auriculariopsis ampla]